MKTFVPYAITYKNALGGTPMPPRALPNTSVQHQKKTEMSEINSDS